MNVLIVEDEVLVGMHIELLVSEFGHTVCGVAATAGEAVALASAHCPDVAIMDIRLADGSNGIDAARRLYDRQRLRCIFLSGNLDEATRAAVRPYEPIAFIGKPLLPVRLQDALEAAQPR